MTERRRKLESCENFTDELRKFCNDLGRKRMVNQLRLGSSEAISNAIRKGRLPAAWFLGCQEIASRRGVRLEPKWFYMKGYAS